MSYDKDTGTYICDDVGCNRHFASYNALWMHRKRQTEPDYGKSKVVIEAESNIKEPEQFANVPVKEKRTTSVIDHGKAATNIALFVVGALLVWIFFRKEISQFLGLEFHDSIGTGMVYNVNGGDIL